MQQTIVERPHIRPQHADNCHNGVGQLGVDVCSSEGVGEMKLTAVGEVAAGGVETWMLGPVAAREEAEDRGQDGEDSDAEARRPRLPRDPGMPTNKEREEHACTHWHFDHGVGIAWPEEESRVLTDQQRPRSKSCEEKVCRLSV